ncbi:hypothetical protein [Roseovarius sp. EL26]|uniref:hypothetical protein n=1 Tax=Roseovarius sp. EL26 TaxID=2126672 RepID=UPI0013C4EE0B|nr:hypothetical protein [Roseovarius sp. EL26]
MPIHSGEEMVGWHPPYGELQSDAFWSVFVKIKCECGAVIPDQTDNLSFKGYVFGDKDWFNFWDIVDEAIENPPAVETKEQTAMRIRRSEKTRMAWECFQCGRLYMDDSQSQLVQYVPINGKYNKILDR